MIYEKDRHLPLGNVTWNAEVAEQALTRILSRALADFTPERHWQTEEEFADKPNMGTQIYRGGMGILWALTYLRDYLSAPLPLDVPALADTLYGKFLEKDVPVFSQYSADETNCPSYWLGETGMLLVMARLMPERADAYAEKLIPLIRQNMRNPTMEPLWGGTGSIIPALFHLEQGPTGVWQNLLVEHARFMQQTITRDNPLQCPIWIQDLYGSLRTLLGAGHGFVGNLYPFIRGQRFLPEDLQQWALNDAVEAVIKSAVVEGDCCNWPAALIPAEGASPKFLLQWCHGAPGVIMSLNGIPSGYSQEFDALMLKAGEAIWQAGPLTKGVGLCHGTDGNGYALLKLHSRTGDPKWLARARAFAMYAIEQDVHEHALWEGDLGFACFLHACLTEDDRFPLLDVC